MNKKLKNLLETANRTPIITEKHSISLPLDINSTQIYTALLASLLIKNKIQALLAITWTITWDTDIKQKTQYQPSSTIFKEMITDEDDYINIMNILRIFEEKYEDEDEFQILEINAKITLIEPEEREKDIVKSWKKIKNIIDNYKKYMKESNQISYLKKIKILLFETEKYYIIEIDKDTLKAKIAQPYDIFKKNKNKTYMIADMKWKIKRW